MLRKQEDDEYAKGWHYIKCERGCFLHDKNVATIIGGGCLLVFVLLIIVGCCVRRYRRRRFGVTPAVAPTRPMQGKSAGLKTKMTKAQVRHRFGGPFQRKQLTVSPAPRLVRRSCSSRGRLMRKT